MTRRLALCLTIFLAAIVSAGRAQTPTAGAPGSNLRYEDSRSGLEAQFADLLKIVRANDEAAIHAGLSTLGIPDADGWIAEHFAPENVAQEQQGYQQGLQKFQSHVWWALGNYSKYPDFALKVEESQIAPALADTGFEGLVPRPKETVKVQNFRFTSKVSDPKLGTQSWVSSFIYLDGKFRMIGGTYPFWAEGLNATRGPMAVPPEVINGRTVQAAAFREDKPGPGVDAIVHIKVEVGHDGKVKKMKVLSGGAAFVPDAKQYLQEAEFAKLPDDPRFANMKAVWDMEVVFFSPKK